MRWLARKKGSFEGEAPSASPSTGERFIADLEVARPSGREGRLFDLVILSLFLHSAGSISEMVQAFVE